MSIPEYPVSKENTLNCKGLALGCMMGGGAGGLEDTVVLGRLVSTKRDLF